MRPAVSPDRVLVVGEALVDVVEDVVHPGGSPLNVAVGLRRLGLEAILHSDFGADAHGVAIARHLEEAGVPVTPGTVSDRPTSVAQATIGPDGGASYVFDVTWDPAPLDVPAGSFDAVHTGSIGAALEPGASEVERLLAAQRPSATISYDPNIRPALMGEPGSARDRVERFVALADVVKSSDEDAAWLYPELSTAEVLERWRGLGASLAVMTRGADGVNALAASGPVHVEAATTRVADTIGAGDSFMAGLIAALGDRGLLGADRRDELAGLDADGVREVVAFGARCAGITVSRPGADPPAREELDA